MMRKKLVIGLSLAVVAAGTAVAEEFANGGFEDGAAGWNLPAKAAVDESVSHSGGKSVRLRVDDPKVDSCYVTRKVPVVPGVPYKASCFVKADNVRDVPGRMASIGAGMLVEWANEKGAWCSAAGGGTKCGIFGTADWKKVECNLKPPPSAAFAQVYLAVRGAGTAWFDDVTFERINVAVEKVAPADGVEMADNAPRFTWNLLNGIGRYTVELSRSPKFEKEKTLSFDAGGLPEYQLMTPLEPGVWHWRVVSAGIDDPKPWRFTQTAPKSLDCIPPQVAARAARVCGANKPFTLLSSEKAAMRLAFRSDGGSPQLKVSGKFVRRVKSGEFEYRFDPPQGGWPKGLKDCRFGARDDAGNVLYKDPFWFLCAPKPENAVVVSADGFYEQNGKRIFPIGTYEVAPKYMDEVRRAGFDVVHTYQWERNQDDAACMEYLDACWRTGGLRAFIGFDRGVQSKHGIMQGNFAHVAHRVGTLCGHPGLFCWYLFDEPEHIFQYVSPGLMNAFAALVRELDPYHPIAVSTIHGHTMSEYRPAYDSQWTQAYGNPADVSVRVDNHRKFIGGQPPITLLVSCNDQEQGAKRRRGIEPDPTRFSRDYANLRACALLAIVKECNGVFWWWFARDTREYYTAAQNPKAWADVVKIVREIADLRRVVNADGAVRTGSAGDEKHPVVWWAKDVAGRKTVFIAINTSEERQKVEINAGGSVGKIVLDLSRYEVVKRNCADIDL